MKKVVDKIFSENFSFKLLSFLIRKKQFYTVLKRIKSRKAGILDKIHSKVWKNENLTYFFNYASLHINKTTAKWIKGCILSYSPQQR